MPDPYWEAIGRKAEQDRSARAVGAPGPKPGRAGQRKWRCLSCGTESWEHWITLNRAARPKCPSCGSIRYEPKTREAKDNMADLRGVRDSFKGVTGTGNGKFVIGS